MKAYEICGGYAHICDCCSKDDGRPTLYWDQQDFDLCYECLESLYFAHLTLNGKDERVVVKRKTITESLRNKIFSRDKNKCVLCDSQESLQIDHILPFSRGGTATIENLQTLCQKCNLQKRDKG